MTLTYISRVWNVNISQTVWSRAKVPMMTLIQVDICYWMSCSMTLTYIFKVKLFTWLFWQVSVEKIKTILLPSERKSGICIEWRHRECCTSWPWRTFSRSWNLKCEYLRNSEILRKLFECDFYRRWYLSPNGINAIVVLRDLDPHFQGQAIAIKKCAGSGCPQADFPRPAMELLLSYTGIHVSNSQQSKCSL